MAGCGDVTSLESLQIQYKHQVFEAEVITGKAGGVAGGADIDYATNQVTGQVQKTMPAIMRDLGFEPASFDFTSGGTLGVNDRSKAVLWPLSSGGDGYWYYWEGALPKVIPASSTPASTGGVLDGAWRPVGDITIRDDLAESSGVALIGRPGGSLADTMPKQDDVTLVVPSNFTSIADALTHISSWRFPSTKVNILVQGSHKEPSTVVVSHVDGERISILGEDLESISVISASVSSPSSPWCDVTIAIGDPSSIDVGDWLLISDSAGTGPHGLIEGCWEVTGKSGATITYRVRSWAKTPSPITISSVSIKKFNTVLSIDNADGVVTRNRIGLIDKIAIIGNSDQYWSSVDVTGTEKGTHGVYAGGLSVLVNKWNDPAQGCASITLGSEVGVNGFDQQGIVADQGSSIFAYYVASCNNKRRGFYSAGGKIRNKFAVANGNYWDGMIADYGAAIESSNVVAAGNRISGLNAFNGGNLSAPNSKMQCNAVNGQSRKGGVLDAQLSSFIDASIRDLLSDAGGNVVADGSSFNSVNENVRATAGSYAQVNDCTFPPGSVHINAQQSLVLHSGSDASSISSVDSSVRDNGNYEEYRHGGPVTVPDYLYCSNQLRVRHQTSAGEYARITPTSAGDVVIGTSAANVLTIKKTGDAVIPSLGDGVTSVGSASARLNTVYSVNGVQTTSDARFKSDVRQMTGSEHAAAAQLAHEIGFWEWLDPKRDREHCGLTVQRAIEVMESHGLAPFDYSFICYEEWGEEWEDELAEHIVENGESVLTPTGKKLLVRKSGSLYQFKDNELNRFLISGCMHEIEGIKNRLLAAGL